MTRTHVPPVLVTGGTGRVGSAVVDLLVDAGGPVRVLTRRSRPAFITSERVIHLGCSRRPAKGAADVIERLLHRTGARPG
jgi:nucleoside-diphosphate-sugar epimerase